MCPTSASASSSGRAERYRHWAATGDKPILLYCAYGERSALALKFMRGAGFENIRHLAGGIDAWINSGAAVEAPEEG